MAIALARPGIFTHLLHLRAVSSWGRHYTWCEPDYKLAAGQQQAHFTTMTTSPELGFKQVLA
jgi:hypothetical protein